MFKRIQCCFIVLSVGLLAACQTATAPVSDINHQSMEPLTLAKSTSSEPLNVSAAIAQGKAVVIMYGIKDGDFWINQDNPSKKIPVSAGLGLYYLEPGTYVFAGSNTFVADSIPNYQLRDKKEDASLGEVILTQGSTTDSETRYRSVLVEYQSTNEAAMPCFDEIGSVSCMTTQTISVPATAVKTVTIPYKRYFGVPTLAFEFKPTTHLKSGQIALASFKVKAGEIALLDSYTVTRYGWQQNVCRSDSNDRYICNIHDITVAYIANHRLEQLAWWQSWAKSYLTDTQIASVTPKTIEFGVLMPKKPVQIDGDQQIYQILPTDR